MARGKLTIFMGNMFANKTGSMMQHVKTMRKFADKRVLVLKPQTDTRSGKSRIKNFNGKTMRAHEISPEKPFAALGTITKTERLLGRKLDTIAFDEVQFFGVESKFFNLVDELLRQGYNVIAAGLMLDFKGEPFGSTLLLIGLCDSVTDIHLLTPFCKKCGNPAPLPQRLINGKPAAYDAPQIKVGGKEAYEARCHTCHELPNRPTFL